MSAEPAARDGRSRRSRIQANASSAAPADADPAAVLRRRARELAQPLRDTGGDAELSGVDHLAFELGGQTYAVESGAVREAVQPPAITRLPGLPATLRGLVNVRSRIVAAFDLRPVLNLRPRSEAGGREILLIVVSGNAEFGILVDELLGMRSVRPDRVRKDIAALQARFLRGIADEALLLLDLDAIARVLTVPDRPAQA